MSKKNKLLLSAFVVASMLAIVGAGTFATFNAQAGNGGNLFADGTLVLSNTVDTAAACLSTGSGTDTDTNVNAGCDTLFSVDLRKPGDTAASGNITIENAGSLDAAALRLFTDACTDADASTETYHGTGSVCDQLQLTVQQYTDDTFGTPLACVYGGSIGASCAFDPAKTVRAFQTTYGTAATGLGLGTLSAGGEQYFRISVQLPTTATNTVQGRQATADFTWYAES